MVNVLRWIFRVIGIGILSQHAVLAAPPETVGFSLLPGAAQATPLEAEVEVEDEFTGLPLLDARVERLQLQGVQVIRVSREGYVSGTVVGVQAARVRFHLKPLPALMTGAVSSGKLSGYIPLLSGNVDGGLVLRSLGIADLLALNVDSLLSPLKDEIQVLGRREIPSNLVFPDQRVGVLIRLNKPRYRLPVSAARRLHLVAGQAAMEVGDLIDQLGNTKPADLVNLLKLRRLGWTSLLEPQGDFSQEISLQHDLNSAFRVNFQLPPYVSDIFALSVLDLSGDTQTLIPTDVKAAKVTSLGGAGLRALALKTLKVPPPGAIQKVIVAAISPQGDRISAQISPVWTNPLPAMSFMVPPLPSRTARGEIPIRAPQGGLSVLTWSREEKGVPVEASQIAVLPSAGLVEIPFQDWGEGRVTNYGLAQLEFGTGISETELDGAGVLKGLSRFTFSRSNFSAR